MAVVLWCLVLWSVGCVYLLVGGVVVSCVSRVGGVCFVCVVFVLLSVLVLVCVALSAFWWVLFSVRGFAPGVVTPPVRCTVLLLVHVFFALLVVLGGSWSSSAVSGSSRSSSFVVLLLV